MPETYFKDSIRVPEKEAAVLMTVISLENHLQQGAYWSQFLNLVDHCFEEKKLEKLIIITTGYLQRHYFSLGSEPLLEKTAIDEKTQALDRHWLEKQNSGLENLKIPYEVIYWQALLNEKSFDAFLQQIKTDYKDNKEFKHLVDNHVNRYVARKISHYCKGNDQIDRNYFYNIAVDYILEECAALGQLFCCRADLLTYPQSINPPANYVWRKYFRNEPLRYVRYETKSLELQHLPAPTVPGCLFTIEAKDIFLRYIVEYMYDLLKQEHWNVTQQYQFIQGFVHLITAINAAYAPRDTPPETITITRRNSL